jgi:hypothetical protein
MPSSGKWRRVDIVNRRFGGPYRLHLQGIRNPRAVNQREQVPTRRFTQDLHGPTTQKTAFFIVTAVKTSNLTSVDFDLNFVLPNDGSRDSVVGIATGYGAGRPRGRSSSPGRVKNFLFSTSSRPVLGSTQPPIQSVPRDLSPEVKRPRREADHSRPASAQVKKMWIYTSTPPYAFMAWCLIR